jgi:YHS domain-containing protein
VQEPVEADPDRAPENAICPVMGNEVDPEIYVDYAGRRIGFCCPGCDKLFLEDPEKYLVKVDAELRAGSDR